MEKRFNSSNEDDNKDFKNNIFRLLSIDSYSLSLKILINTFNILIILSIFFFNYILMNNLFQYINDIYFSKSIIEPISIEYELLIQQITIRLRALDDIVIESKLENGRIISEFIVENDNFKIKQSNNIENFKILPINNYFNTLKNYSKVENEFEKKFNERQIENLEYYMKLIFTNSYISVIASQFIYCIDGNKINCFSICQDCFQYKDFYVKYVSDILYNSTWGINAIKERNPSSKINLFNRYKKNDNNLEFNQSEYYDLFRSKNLSIKFFDKIVKNEFAENDLTNYLKVMHFPLKINNQTKNIFIGFRYSNEELKNLLNRGKRNLTVIYQRENSIENNHTYNDEYAILPCHDYLIFFFEYSFGINNELLNQIKNDKISYSTNSILKIHKWDSYLIKNILNSSLSLDTYTILNRNIPKSDVFFKEKILDKFNFNFYKEVVFMGFFITYAVRENFNEKFGNSLLDNLPKSFIDNSDDQLKLDLIKYFDDKNSTHELFCRKKINLLEFEFDFCRYVKNANTIGNNYPFNRENNSNNSEIVTIYLDNNQTINPNYNLSIFTDEYTREINLLKYYNKYNETYKIFLGTVNETWSDDISNKSFWIYISFINGLKMIYFEMLNFENYINLKNTFERKMWENYGLVIILTITICIIIFFLIFYFSIHFVKISHRKIYSIRFIKDNLFYKQLAVNYFNEISKEKNIFIEGEFVIEIVHFIRKCYEKRISKYDIIKLDDENEIDLLKINIYISIEYSRKLRKIVKKVIESNFILFFISLFFLYIGLVYF